MYRWLIGSVMSGLIVAQVMAGGGPVATTNVGHASQPVASSLRLRAIGVNARPRLPRPLAASLPAPRWMAPAGAVASRTTAATICRVNASATGTGDGSTWATAYHDLQQALVPGRCNEVWVAAGTYTPVVPASATSVTAAERSKNFWVPPGLALYGGFAGNETTRDARDAVANVTVLSGDLLGDDVVSPFYNADNSKNLVVLIGTAAQPIDNTTIVDGFTIRGANADGTSGGGIYVRADGAGATSNPLLSHLVLDGNHAGQMGGGILVEAHDSASVQPTIRQVHFTANASGLYAGALGLFATNSGVVAPVVSDAQFDGNVATYGGAVATYLDAATAAPSFARVSFTDNTASSFGGAVVANTVDGGSNAPAFTDAWFSDNYAQRGGAMLNMTSDAASRDTPTLQRVTFDTNRSVSDGGGAEFFATTGASAGPVLANVTFSRNENLDVNGGAIYFSSDSASTGNLTLTNVTLADNIATGQGSAIYGVAAGAGNLTAWNLVAWGNTSAASALQFTSSTGTQTFDHSLIEGGCPVSSVCPQLLQTDPRLRPLGRFGGYVPTRVPQLDSPLVDTGDANHCPPVDARGVARPQGAACDIGAVEVEAVDDVIFRDGFDGAGDTATH